MLPPEEATCLNTDGEELRRGSRVQLLLNAGGWGAQVGMVLHIHTVPSGWDGRPAAFVTVWWPATGTIATHHWSRLGVVNHVSTEEENK